MFVRVLRLRLTPHENDHADIGWIWQNLLSLPRTAQSRLLCPNVGD
jgi:hypothetical protein